MGCSDFPFDILLYLFILKFLCTEFFFYDSDNSHSI